MGQISGCVERYDVGDQPTIVFRFKPTLLHPSDTAGAVTVTVRRPDGSTFGTYTSPDLSLSVDTHVIVVADEDGMPVNLTVTDWTFEMPTPFDAGSNRKPWMVRCKSTATIIAAVEVPLAVRYPAMA